MKGFFMLAALFLAAGSGRADEGMWTIDRLPLEQLSQRYAFTPDPEWIEKVKSASVRFNDGGSGAFVSPRGLVLTNHHVARGQLQKLSGEKTDYVKNGFFARRPSEELPCPDLELNVLVSTEDVTARVRAAAAGASESERNARRKAELARVEKECFDKTKLRCDVVEFYRGGQYQLYRYKKYTDVRLVMAPEARAAAFGGDYDNFVYPRHELDLAFFRVYEEGKPVESPAYFKWSAGGAKEGELVFVAGHPWATQRLLTVRQLEYQRDQYLPAYLVRRAARIRALEAYSARGPEAGRRAYAKLSGFANGLKAVTGYLQGIKSPEVMAVKKADEEALRAAVAARPELAAAGAWEAIAAATDKKSARFKDLTYRSADDSQLAGFAQQIVRWAAEVEKPNESRYEEFRDSNLDSMRLKLFSRAPVYPDLEEVLLALDFQESLDQLGPDHPYVKAALGGKTPAVRARELISGTRLAEPDFRKKLVSGGRKAAAASEDPLIVWARGVEPLYREMRKWREDEIESVESLEGGRIARARLAVLGAAAYPDATATLRLSYGKVAGYEEGTTKVPYKTNFYGLYARAESFDNQPPFDLSPLEAERKDDVGLATPLDFVTTNDVIGGNSGSPVINRRGEYVGLVFDLNVPALVWNFAYTEAQARTVAVHSAGVLEGLRKIYRMYSLADELAAP
ncbi:MAG: S46 family peptidase [Elusimicrobia bacterium]|nr:S46 family peptidase [Elusimicrobiota bacterium]